jgi:hypothetical protein
LKLLLDAMLPSKLATPLREHGIDAEAIDGVQELTGLSDDRVIEWGRAENRVIVTRNVDHFCERGRRAIAEGVGHAGLILLPRRRGGIGRLIAELLQLAEEFPGDEDLRDREVWL